MYLLDARILGIAILLLLGVLVIVKQTATGSILENPKGELLVQFVNIYNLFFLLVVNPVAAILLIAGLLPTSDPTHIVIGEPAAKVLEVIGLVFYVLGFLLMAWALRTLKRNYQLGGSTPRPDDRLVVDGPYRLVRHPMYTAALSIALGLAFLMQSWAFFGVFFVYLVLIIPLIPLEETALQIAYDGQYSVYQEKTRRLIPLVY